MTTISSTSHRLSCLLELALLWLIGIFQSMHAILDTDKHSKKRIFIGCHRGGKWSFINHGSCKIYVKFHRSGSVSTIF